MKIALSAAVTGPACTAEAESMSPLHTCCARTVQNAKCWRTLLTSTPTPGWESCPTSTVCHLQSPSWVAFDDILLI